MKKYVVGFLAGLVLVAGLAGAASISGVQALVGALVDVSSGTPVLAITGGTSAQKGGSNAGQYLNTATTAAGTLTFPDAVNGGRVCDFNDETTPADKVTQGNATDGKTVVTVVGTVSAGDLISYQCTGYDH